jgi:hypothetical protein
LSFPSIASPLHNSIQSPSGTVQISGKNLTFDGSVLLDCQFRFVCLQKSN